MPEFSIESNGRIEKTAVYYNGDQLRGVREIMLNLDENGAFDAVVQYQGTDEQLHTKQIFADLLENVQTMEPSFTEEEAAQLRLITIRSDGDINNTFVYINDEEQGGIVSLFLHMKAPAQTSQDSRPEFKAEITYRNDDDSLSTEGVF